MAVVYVRPILLSCCNLHQLNSSLVTLAGMHASGDSENLEFFTCAVHDLLEEFGDVI